LQHPSYRLAYFVGGLHTPELSRQQSFVFSVERISVFLILGGGRPDSDTIALSNLAFHFS
jgi:hypothetical protein